MTPTAIGVLALTLSVDAFIAALGKGAVERRVGFRRALRTGAIFGAVEALTPLLGWALGVAASHYVAAVDHWVAFALLGAVGAHMILVAISAPRETPEAGRGGLWSTVAAAVGSSIDAMAVGVSLAFLEVNILVVAAAIGLATMAMSTTGVLAGRFLGRRLGRIVGVGGGLALIGLGASILAEHLGWV
ncbi:manganese efflux pump MntP family protein [Albimonas sp. CAU 1670]|uniref:manganese efflux pump MntP n=1 Tax=Albimonas sp. CAU 1670 TaxID=3032599 RepID=UPI0023DCDA7E|nr:manganese efflux pump MntP family protein [Albimonas sp. CAU 1670]MDF2235628.1 manganese efflux pump MntP family protein [Albimonas sp. CAU 1670]